MIAIQDFIQQTLLSLSLVTSGVSLYGVSLPSAFKALPTEVPIFTLRLE